MYSRVEKLNDNLTTGFIIVEKVYMSVSDMPSGVGTPHLQVKSLKEDRNWLLVILHDDSREG